MLHRHRLRDDQWDKIKDALPGKQGDPGRTADDNRRFVEAVMWIARTGAPWRDLPSEYGKWSGIHKRFIRWAKSGIWQMIFNTLAVDADTEWLMIDSTIIRAHQHAAGAKGGSKNKLQENREEVSAPKSMGSQMQLETQSASFFDWW